MGGKRAFNLEESVVLFFRYGRFRLIFFPNDMTCAESNKGQVVSNNNRKNNYK